MLNRRGVGSNRRRGGPRTNIIPLDPIQIVSTSIRHGFQGVEYTPLQLNASGGEGTKVWTIEDGSLPGGITLSSGGLLEGEPTLAGVYADILIRVTDDSGFDEETFSFTIVTPSIGDNAYFDDLSAMDVVFEHSLRTAGDINSLSTVNPTTYFTYDASRDACKYYKECDDKLGNSSDATPGTQNLKKFYIVRNSGRILVTWDAYFPDIWKYSSLLKMWNTWVGDGEPNKLGQRGITYTNDPDVEALPVMANLFPRDFWSATAGNTPAGGTYTDSASCQPPGEGALTHRSGRVYANVWTRYWYEFIFNVAGTDPLFDWWRTRPAYLTDTLERRTLFESSNWDCISYWVADEDRAPFRVLFHVPGKRINNPFVQNHVMEFNTSFLPPTQVWLQGDANGSSNGAGTVFTLPVGTDLTEISEHTDELAAGHFKLWVGSDAVKPVKDLIPVMHTIQSVNVGARTVTLTGSTVTGDLVNTNWKIGGPIYMWIKNAICIENYDLGATPEDDVFIFRLPVG